MGKVATKSELDTNQKWVGDVLGDASKKEAPGHYSRGLSYWLKSGDFVPKCYLAGVRGSRTHLPRSSRGITDLKCVATPSVK